MSETVGDYLLERLRTWGIKRIYGYPGDGINGIIGAFSRLSDGEGPEFTQVRHEEMAAFMACAHAKFTGEVGVCLATSGPGAIHLLNGLYDAKLDHQPVVAIVGQQARAGIGGNYQQEVDLNSLFKDVAHEYVEVAMAPDPDPPPHRPGHPDRARRAHGDRDHHPQRRAGRRSRPATAAQARHGPLRPWLPAAADPPPRRGPRPGSGDPERGGACCDVGRTGRAARLRGGGASRRSARRRAWPRRCSARPFSLTNFRM